MVYAIYYTVVLHHRIVYRHIPNGYLKLCSHHLVYNICVAFVLRIMTASALPRAAPAAPTRSAPASPSRCPAIASALPRTAPATPTRHLMMYLAVRKEGKGICNETKTNDTCFVMLHARAILIARGDTGGR